MDVTVIICTCDRPLMLERLLGSIERQETTLSFEIIVVDNNPTAGSNRPLRTRFANVTWLDESRRGLSRARNAGVRAAQGQAVVFADDDLVVSSSWLQGIASPVLAGHSDVVLGPVEPLSLESEAQRLFESFGGHGFSRMPAEFDARWLRSQRISLPLWRIGGVGNAAVRRTVFLDARIGFFEEALGAGTPAGSWEDLYFLYRSLRANLRIRREPAAAALHAHRETMEELTLQLCSYRRGEVCFCILVFLRHLDFRALSHLVCHIPWWRLQLLGGEAARRLRGRKLLPFPLMWKECTAYLQGPWSLAVSLRRAAALRHRGD